MYQLAQADNKREMDLKGLKEMKQTLVCTVSCVQTVQAVKTFPEDSALMWDFQH